MTDRAHELEITNTDLRRLPSHSVYLLFAGDGTTYVGYTSRCIKQRLAEHNSLSNRGWTRGRRWRLLALRMFLDADSARMTERQLKRSKYDKRNWLARLDRLSVLQERHGFTSR